MRFYYFLYINYAKLVPMNKFNEIQDISKNTYELSCENFEHDEIFRILEEDEDYKKPIAILNFDSLNIEDAEKLVFYLTNQKGPTREAVSMVLAEFSPSITESMKMQIIDALCDVNPNVCRNIIDYLKKTNSSILKDDILKRINEILLEIDLECAKFRKNMEKNHILNKKIFHLYWCLEGLCCVIDENDSEVEKLLYKTADFYDYTIREKTAQILNKIKNAPLSLIDKLKGDENFYVRNKF